MKYIEAKKFRLVNHKDKRKRANPDTDRHTYSDSFGTIYTATYRKNAKSIIDVDYPGGQSQYYEHPYESMSIEAESLLNF